MTEIEGVDKIVSVETICILKTNYFKKIASNTKAGWPVFKLKNKHIFT